MDIISGIVLADSETEKNQEILIKIQALISNWAF